MRCRFDFACFSTVAMSSFFAAIDLGFLAP